MSRLKLLKQRANRKEVYPFKHNNEWLVYSEAEGMLGPRGPFPKRQLLI